MGNSKNDKNAMKKASLLNKTLLPSSRGRCGNLQKDTTSNTKKNSQAKSNQVANYKEEMK
jgi:hypothetical protein